MAATETRYHTGISSRVHESLRGCLVRECLSDSADLPNRLSICLDVGARHALQEM